MPRRPRDAGLRCRPEIAKKSGELAFTMGFKAFDKLFGEAERHPHSPDNGADRKVWVRETPHKIFSSIPSLPLALISLTIRPQPQEQKSDRILLFRNKEIVVNVLIHRKTHTQPEP